MWVCVGFFTSLNPSVPLLVGLYEGSVRYSLPCLWLMWLHQVCQLLPDSRWRGSGGWHSELQAHFDSPDSVRLRLTRVFSHFTGESREAPVRTRSGSPGCYSGGADGCTGVLNKYSAKDVFLPAGMSNILVLNSWPRTSRLFWKLSQPPSPNLLFVTCPPSSLGLAIGRPGK